MKMEETKKHLSKKSGFTLIEVILVVVILGIIAGVTMNGLNIGGKKQQADLNAAKSTIATLSMAVQQYEIINGTYPSSLDALLDESKGGPFLQKKKIPLDPWGKPFVYQAPGTHNTHTFDISCTSEDGKATANNWD
ncbi:prepilin-type N-terminal cleavage/methylation domain-containing protein [Verrucomicrobia bacterium S94]|nr:prepilin-type N-terminal cleavage/methylation domain-containing protein [Verrucomicrobia bacterium S94]